MQLHHKSMPQHHMFPGYVTVADSEAHVIAVCQQCSLLAVDASNMTNPCMQPKSMGSSTAEINSKQTCSQMSS